MYEFHKDKIEYFNIQKEVTKGYIIPFLEKYQLLDSSMKILEIGCAEAGVLKAFVERGHQVIGIELSEGRVELAKMFLEEEIKAGNAQIINKNIYHIDKAKDLPFTFDLIILKDVIEHIPEQENFIPKLKEFLSPGGMIMFGFPPWYMPFGGHQQICNNKILAKLPWYHLLPFPLYKAILKMGGEGDAKINSLIEIKETGISIERLKRIIKKSHYKIIGEQYWLFNPIYKWKFGINPKLLWAPLRKLWGIRNFYTTALYILFKVDE